MSSADTEVVRFQEIGRKWGHSSAKTRASSYLASRFIGRDFGQSAETFYASNPKLAALRDWVQQGAKL